MNRRIQFFLAALATASMVAGAYVGIGKAQPTLNLPFATVTSVTTAGQQIIGSNPSRRSIQICFPAVAGSVTFAPAPITPVSLTTGITVTLTATPSTPICYTPPPLTASGTTGGAGAAWNAIASTTINVTVLEW
jgi:hypothetical protein